MFELRNSSENIRKRSHIFFENLPRAYKDLIYIKKNSKLFHACVPLNNRKLVNTEYGNAVAKFFKLLNSKNSFYDLFRLRLAQPFFLTLRLSHPIVKAIVQKIVHALTG